MTDRVLVAPREIRDLVERACRVVGCGPSIAADVAAAVTRREIEHGGGVLAFVELAETRPQDVQRFAAGPAVDSTRDRDALANGVAVDASAWRRIEVLAADFLLAERIIDGDA